MDHPTHTHEDQLLTALHAAEWLDRMKSAGPPDRWAFLRWLRRSPDNLGETLLATSTDILLREFFRNRSIKVEELGSNSSNVIHVVDRVRPAAQPRRRHRGWAWAASVGLGLATAAATLAMRPAVIDHWLHPNAYKTSVGEQRAVALADGSIMSIDARSSVRVQYSPGTRDVYLDSGQAMFSVAKDPARPFRVHVADSIVQAVGTKFDVRRRRDRTQVSVVEGTVQITVGPRAKRRDAALRPLSELARVTAGQAVSIVDTGEISVPAPINVAVVGAWQQRRLVFSDSTLAEIADEFARYNREPHLRVEGDALRARRLSGVFDADSPEGLLIYLRSDPSLAIERNRDEVVIRLRRDRQAIELADG